MRFMMLMIPKGYENAEPGAVPSCGSGGGDDEVQRALQKAGVLLALDGLHPPSMGARVTFAGGKAKVTDGPFTEAKEVVGGYWMIQVKSKEEAIEWATRCPGATTAPSRFGRCRSCPISLPTCRRPRPGFSEMQSGKRNPA